MKDVIKKHAAKLLGDSFVFRAGQLEAIERIVQNVVANKKQTILEAPTGSGKSIIAMLAAYVLFKEHDKKSYILVSDLSLYAQYENDIKKLNDNCFSFIKGKENYICAKNRCPASQSVCSLQNVSPMAIGQPKYAWRFPCREKCQYVKEYVKAVHSPITLMTYQLYFIQRNYVEDVLMGGLNTNFPKRDLVVCDECHNLCSICQSHFAPRAAFQRPGWMNTLDNYYKLTPHEDERLKIVKSMAHSKTSDELCSFMTQYASYISTYVTLNEIGRDSLANKKKLTPEEKAVLKAGNAARQEHCKYDDMLSFVSDLGKPEHMAKSVDEDGVTMNYIFDDVMLKKYMHQKSGCELFMSATVGDFRQYAADTGLDVSTCGGIQLSSTFDFSKSPIFYSTQNKMSWQEKDASTTNIINQIDEICKKHMSEKGIIQTGSYANAKQLKWMLSEEVRKRCLFYDGSKEKSGALQKFMSGEKSNCILVGPTLLEGLNFPDDACRFQISMKVPYGCLGSEYIAKKKDAVPGWYVNDAITKICQGIGRGVRHEHDWCETYLLDGCITYILPQLKQIEVLSGRFQLLR